MSFLIVTRSKQVHLLQSQIIFFIIFVKSFEQN